jgi:hypothetical protein
LFQNRITAANSATPNSRFFLAELSPCFATTNAAGRKVVFSLYARALLLALRGRAGDLPTLLMHAEAVMPADSQRNHAIGVDHVSVDTQHEARRQGEGENNGKKK